MSLLMRWCILCLFVLSFAPTVRAQTDERCFDETGYCMSGRIREYWEQNGGLPVFGYPITPQREEIVEGQPRQVQWFERNRLELHPENAPPYDVLLGRLGVVRLEQQGRNWFTFPKGQPQDGCLFFEDSEHTICEPFLNTWQSNGLELDGVPGKTQAESLALFGLPISEPQTETMSDGKEYTVQWFERARFELHPENDPPFNVLLGLLGNEVFANQDPATPPPPQTPQPAVPTATPAPEPLPAPTFNNCWPDPNPDAAPNYPVQIVAIDKAEEVVQLQNVSPEPVNLDGWRMCSIRGNQEHPIGGTLAPGETRSFPGPTGPIWSNSEPDDGALYNAAGQLVSYYRD